MREKPFPDLLWWTNEHKNAPISDFTYMGELTNKTTALSSTNHWAEALKRFCITVGGVAAAVSVFVKLNQYSQILRRQCCLGTLVLSYTYTKIGTRKYETGKTLNASLSFQVDQVSISLAAAPGNMQFNLMILIRRSASPYSAAPPMNLGKRKTIQNSK